MEYKESKPGLCDLIRSRLNNRNYLVNRDNAFRDFGLYASQLLDTMEGPFDLPELKMLNAFKKWLVDFFDQNNTYKTNQTENYIYMRNSLQKMIAE